MTPFILLYVYLILVWFFTRKIKDTKKKSKKQCVYSFLGLLFLLGLHSPTLGVDVDGFYIPYFHTSTQEGISFVLVGHIEPLFHAITFVIRTFTDNESIYIFLIALLILLPIIFFFYKESKNPWLAIYFYVSFIIYYFAFSGIRQALAISIVCLGYYYLLKDNWKFFLLFVLIAFFIHTSALLAVLALPLVKIKISDFSWFVVYGLLTIAILAVPTLMLTVVDIIFSDTGKYQNTLNEDGGGITLSFLYLAFAALQIFMSLENKEKSMVQFTLLLFTIQLTGLRSQYAARIGYYFLPLMFIYITNAIESLKDKDVKVILNLFLTGFLLFFFIYSSSGGYLGVIPFKFFWE